MTRRLFSCHFLFFHLLPLLVAGLATRSALAGPPRHYALEGQEKPVALLPVGRRLYLVTEHAVLERQGRQFVRRYRSEAPIRCALAQDTALWLGTQQGVLRLSTKQFRARPLALPDVASPAAITALCQDAVGGVWVGAVGYGMFRLRGGRFEKVLSAPTVNAALATADSSVWIGSNLGLNRYRRGQWTRYNEEGVTNHEIPDNIVEKLLPDHAGNLWVLMSAGISVFPTAAAGAAPPAELPTATFIGQPGNEVFSIASLPGLGRVFATAMGPLLLPETPAGQFASFEPSASDKVEPKRALRPLPLPGARPQLIQPDQQGRVWVVSADGVRVWRGRAFRQLAQGAAPMPPEKRPAG